MTAWASIERDPTWLARLTAEIVWPALFLYLDWPTGEVFATTHPDPVTINGQTWTGTNNLAYVRGPAFTSSDARVSYQIGLASLPLDGVDLDIEATAIGRRAILYEGLFAEGWVDPVLDSVFWGHVRTAGDIEARREKGQKIIDASIEISNGRNPRRPIQTYHSPATAAPGDTAWGLTPSVGKAWMWPA